MGTVCIYTNNPKVVPPSYFHASADGSFHEVSRSNAEQTDSKHR